MKGGGELDSVNTSKDILKGALILTAAAIFIKILSATYRVPFQNIVGDVGYYIYQQVYPFYGIALVLATSGFPVVISKLYVEQKSKYGISGIKQLFAIGASILMIVGFVGFFTLYYGAEWLAVKMDDPALAKPLQVASYSFLILPILSLLRGYFQGKANMIPTAVSQVAEQLVRVAVILGAALLLTKQGYSLYDVSGGAYYGAFVGGFTALFILVLFIIKSRAGLPIQIRMRRQGSWLIAKALLTQGFAICVSSLLLIFIQLADSLNLYSLLVASGFGELEAKELKGVYDRGQPLIQLGSVIATSMALSLVPLITKEQMNQSNTLNAKINLILRISIMISVAATAGLWSIIEPTNRMLFENGKGSDVLAILSILILLSSLIITVTAVLQGLGYPFFSAVLILLGCGLKYVLNTIYVPVYGLTGAATASCITLCMILVLLLIKLRRHVKGPFISIRFLFVIFIAAAVMVLLLTYYLKVTNGLYDGYSNERISAGIQALSAVIIGAVVYLFIVIRGNTFTEEELEILPFGNKLLLFKKGIRR
ncbi:putative polysaccharide biosynthesis protein [Cytobacillus horneckiae]|uniref:putative polysaccharide biosynthesis protein n=1 Tax=Cytobacillus horneckiae TaxID=549687 RepID=UPI003D9A39D7